MKRTTLFLLLTIFTLACNVEAQPRPAALAPYLPRVDTYAFMTSEAGPLVRLEAAFPTPTGFRRVEVKNGSFGAWLRALPLLRDRVAVRSYKGERLSSPSAGIVPLDVGSRDLQQCADSVIRLHAEYLWAHGRQAELGYHFTSGDEVRFADWIAGERIRAVGSKVTRSSGPRRPANHASLRSWLDLVFMYAGTRSLSLDSVAVAPGDVSAGDFYVAPGSPGHAVIVLDVAVDDGGRQIALLGQGFMPAQEFHVLRAEGDAILDGNWFVLPDAEEAELVTPSWKPFYGADARRFAR